MVVQRRRKTRSCGRGRTEGQGLAAAGKSVTVQANVTVIVIIIIIIVEPTNGDLLIRKEDEHGNLLAGACFTLTPLEGGDPIELCDGDEDDGSGAGGLIRFNNLRRVPMNFPNRPPPGYAQAPNDEIEIEAGQTLQITVPNQPLEETGELVVIKTDTEDNLARGACWRLQNAQGQVVVAQVCDDDDGDEDGVTTFGDVRSAPGRSGNGRAGGLRPCADRWFRSSPDRRRKRRSRTACNLARSWLRSGARVRTATCWPGLFPPRWRYELRRDLRQRRWPERWPHRFLGVIPADYDVVETVTPPGYQTADPDGVTAVAGRP